MPKPYEAAYPVGVQVRVKSRDSLERFAEEWKFHDPLTADQLGYAGTVSYVKAVGFYHGGDPLYQLEAVPGVWHEECLSPAE